MATVGAYEAKTHLPKLLERVARGETITITKHGTPVAVLTPPPRPDRTELDRVMREVAEIRATIPPDPEGWSVVDYVKRGRP